MSFFVRSLFADSEGQGGEERRVRSEGQQHIGRRDIVH